GQRLGLPRRRRPGQAVSAPAGQLPSSAPRPSVRPGPQPRPAKFDADAHGEPSFLHLFVSSCLN
uniref:Uncharacterized protein n=1 Tax=Aegilops tauschii subsp. strangulata TaxID=200361 RepID=A0A452ZVX7_AEGTS